jgi:hypothetical protein
MKRKMRKMESESRLYHLGNYRQSRDSIRIFRRFPYGHWRTITEGRQKCIV